MFILRLMRRIKKQDPDFPKLRPRIAHKELSPDVVINKELCSACKGVCCKVTGCFFSPFDFEKLTEEYLTEYIKKSGYISIRYIGKGRSGQGTGVFVLSVRNHGADIVDIPFQNNGGCCLLTENGCPFSDSERPTGGKLLIPVGGIDKTGVAHCSCVQSYRLEDLCYEWLPYKKMLQRISYRLCGENSGVPDK